VTGRLPDPPLLVITDRATAVAPRATAVAPMPDIIAAALRGGCRWVMLRDKNAEGDEIARDLVALCHDVGALVVVNGDVEQAARLNADGVHLQSASMVAPARAKLGITALIGVSCHSTGDISAAEASGADYATLSPVFLTDSKPRYGPALGLEGLGEACSTTRLPILALAGIDAGNASSCLAAGAAGIAVMGGVMRATDAKTTVQELIGELSSAGHTP
jgi:thiamine-phosphate pyrophosphorylase